MKPTTLICAVVLGVLLARGVMGTTRTRSLPVPLKDNNTFPFLPGAAFVGGLGAGMSVDLSQMTLAGIHQAAPRRPVIALRECWALCKLPKYWPYCEMCYNQFGVWKTSFWSPPGLTPVWHGDFDQTFYVNISSTAEGYTEIQQTDSTGGSFITSSTTEHLHYYKQFWMHESVMTLATRTISLFSLDLADTSSHTPEFEAAVALLPEGTYEDNSDAYHGFIRDVGTHYATSVVMGARMSVKMYINKCVLTMQSEDMIAKHSSTLGLYVTGHNNTEVAKHSLLYNYSKTEVEILGGIVPKLGAITAQNPMTNAELTAWENSLLSNPELLVPVSITALPLTYLINDIDPAKAAAFQQALVAYNTSINAANAAYVQSIKPFANTTVPSWCKKPPPPPTTATTSFDVEDTQASRSSFVLPPLHSIELSTRPPPPTNFTPSVPGTMTGRGPNGGKLGEMWNPIYMESTGAPLPFTYTNYNGDNNSYVRRSDNTPFRKPDQLSLVATPSITVDITARSFSNMSSYETWSSSYSGWAIPLITDVGVGALAHFDYSETVNHLLHGENNTVFHTQVQITELKASLPPASVLAHHLAGASLPFALAVDELVLATKLGKATPSTYYNFLARWGAYYCSSSFLGGQVDIFISVTNEWMVKTTLDIDASVTAFIFLSLIDLGMVSASVAASLHVHLEEMAEFEIVIMAQGGNPLKLGLGSDLKGWLPTISSNPAPLPTPGGFTPVYELVQDPGTQAALKAATVTWLNETSARPTTNATCTVPDGSASQLKDLPSVKAMMQQAPPSPPAETSVGPASPATVTALDVSGVGTGFNLKTGIPGVGLFTPTPGSDTIVFMPFGLGNSTSVGSWDPAGAAGRYVSVPRAITICTTPQVCAKGNITVVADIEAWVAAEGNAMLAGFGLAYYGIPIFPGGWLADSSVGVALMFAGGVHTLATFELKLPLVELTFGTGPHTDVSPAFAAAVANLPPSPNNDTAFFPFFDAFSTHYTHSYELGAYLNITASLEATLVAKYGASVSSTIARLYWIAAVGAIKAAKDLINDLKAGLPHLLNGDICAAFEASTNVTVCACGGNVASLMSGTNPDFAAWLPTVADSPSIIPRSTRLRPISQLVSNSSVEAAMNVAAGRYLNSSSTSGGAVGRSVSQPFCGCFPLVDLKLDAAACGHT